MAWAAMRTLSLLFAIGIVVRSRSEMVVLLYGSEQVKDYSTPARRWTSVIRRNT